MTMTDPVADLLTRIRNSHIAKHDRLDVPTSKLKRNVCALMKQEGYLTDFEEVGDGVKRVLRIYLRYAPDGTPAVQHMARVSKAGRRVYRGATDLPVVLNGLGTAIVSTSRGLLTDSEAREQGVGGEILCELW